MANVVSELSQGFRAILTNTRLYRYWRAHSYTERRYQRFRSLYPRQMVRAGVKIGYVLSTGPARVLLVVSRHGWHSDLERGWNRVAPTTCFDPPGYEVLTKEPEQVARYLDLRQQWCDRLLKASREASLDPGRDVIFLYTNTSQLTREAALALRETSGCPTVLMSLDDKNSWEGPRRFQDICALKPLAGVVTLYWTSARECVPWVAAEGGTPIYLPEGADETIYRPVSVEKDIDVCFLGAAYGFRKAWIDRLRRRGLRIQCYGSGWGPESYVRQAEIPRLFSRSKVVLGHGGIGYSEVLTNVKGRDFEVPMTGGGVYITSFNPDLALHFEHGKEVLFYRNDEECEYLVNWVLANPAEAAQMSQRARERCLKMHTWAYRFQTVLSVLRGELAPEEAWKTCSV